MASKINLKRKNRPATTEAQCDAYDLSALVPQLLDTRPKSVALVEELSRDHRRIKRTAYSVPTSSSSLPTPRTLGTREPVTDEDFFFQDDDLNDMVVETPPQRRHVTRVSLTSHLIKLHCFTYAIGPSAAALDSKPSNLPRRTDPARWEGRVWGSCVSYLLQGSHHPLSYLFWGGSIL
jgi:hypothetical protein